ncbi:MAG: hypothetical protein ACR2LI_05695 [Propionibacteriaceae bacterium]
MKTVYRVVAFVIAAGVMAQAAAVAFGFFGLGVWVDGGGTLDKAAFESDSISFLGVAGLAFHGIVGTMVMPVLALIFLVVGIMAQVVTKLPGALAWSLSVVVATAVQVVLGLAAHSYPLLGVLHGLVAFVLFGLAAMAAVRVGRATPQQASRANADRALV